MDIFSIETALAAALGAFIATVTCRYFAKQRQNKRERRSFDIESNINLPPKEELLSHIPTGIGLVEGRTMLWANPAMSRIIGYEPQDYRGKDSRLLYPNDEEYRRVGAILGRDLLGEKGEAELEAVLQRKDGSLVPCLFHMVRLSGTGPKQLSLIAITDISIPKGMQEALREKGEKYQAIFQELPVGIFRSTISGRFIEVNRTLAELFGYPGPEEMIDEVRDISADLYLNPGIRKKIIDTVGKESGMRRFEVEFKRRDGSRFPARLLLQVIREEAGLVRYMEGIVEDISEEKEAEAQIRAYQTDLEQMVADRTRDLENTRQQLIDAERLASLGSLMGGIAHEINNPLGVALTAGTHLASRTAALRSSFDAGELTKKELNRFIDNAEESAQIVARNLERARGFISDIKQVAVDQSSEQRRRFNLSEYIGVILSSLKPLLKRSPVEVKLDCGEDIQIESYPGALSQVLTNLIMNSLTHAFENRESGLITISARIEAAKLLLILADDGIGMSDEVRDRVFEAYFTTKRDQGGSGLGLHIVATTVKEVLGGEISLASAPDAGSTFTISIPLS